MPPASDFVRTFDTLRAILARHAKQMIVTVDEPARYVLASPTLVDRIGRPLFCAAVEIKKNYVSYHLMPIYMNPALRARLSPSLKKRMQGKSCFNFTTVEPAQAKELAAITKLGIGRSGNTPIVESGFSRIHAAPAEGDPTYCCGQVFSGGTDTSDRLSPARAGSIRVPTGCSDTRPSLRAPAGSCSPCRTDTP